jgi:hypothetical protein
LLWSLIAVSLLLAFAILFLTYNSPYRWLGHAVVSLTGLILVIVVVVNGATLSGRLKRGATNVYGLHRNVSVLFSLFMVGTFFFGLWVTYSHDEALLTSIHSWIGLAIVVLAFIQVAPCFVTKQRAKVRSLHMVAGFAVAVLVVVQVAWGLEIALVSVVKDLVLIHSTFGAIAAFALTWMIVEMRHLTPKGVSRAKIASYIVVFFNIVGCWVVSGIYYVSIYGSQIRPVILGGPYPWIHRIVMETKEHVFLFLPVLSLTLMLTLVWLGKDETLIDDSRVKKAVIALAALALAMIILNFIFGILVSFGGNPIGGD